MNRRNWRAVGFLSLMLAAGTLAFAQGGIDWQKGYVEVVGTGVPPANASKTQGRLLARRAAMLDGYRQLGEIVFGVNVDSETTVKNFVVESDVIRTKVDATIKGTQIVAEKEQPDGSYEVTMRMPVAGEGGLTAVLLPEAKKKEEERYKAQEKPLPPPLPPAPKPPEEKIKETPPPPTLSPGKAAGDKTGLIIDARNLGAAPAMSPKIIAESGDVVYGIINLGPELADLVNEKGIVGYARDMEAAKQSWRSGAKPLVIKGKTVSGPLAADVTVSDADAALIKAENDATGFLQHFRVTIVY